MQAYLVPVLSVAASFRSIPKKRHHTMPKAPLGPAYSPPPRSNCAAKKLCQRQQRVRLPLRHQHFVKMMDSLPRAIVYDWREPLHQRPAVERLAPHHVPFTVVMRQLVVRQHRVCLLGLLVQRERGRAVGQHRTEPPRVVRAGTGESRSCTRGVHVRTTTARARRAREDKFSSTTAVSLRYLATSSAVFHCILRCRR